MKQGREKRSSEQASERGKAEKSISIFIKYLHIYWLWLLLPCHVIIKYSPSYYTRIHFRKGKNEWVKKKWGEREFFLWSNMFCGIILGDMLWPFLTTMLVNFKIAVPCNRLFVEMNLIITEEVEVHTTFISMWKTLKECS